MIYDGLDVREVRGVYDGLDDFDALYVDCDVHIGLDTVMSWMSDVHDGLDNCDGYVYGGPDDFDVWTSC